MVPQQGQLCRLQQSGLVDMDPWQAPGYHQSGSVDEKKETSQLIASRTCQKKLRRQVRK